MKTRLEKDSLGEFAVPETAAYGIQTARAAANFPVSGIQVHRELIRSYLLLKRAASTANEAAKTLDTKRARTIRRAIDEILKEDFTKHFIVDAFQAGAGTSQNMNVNEVVANRANALLGKPAGSYDPVHPNDHVNMSQSTNDTYPTAMRLSIAQLSKGLARELHLLAVAFDHKARETDAIVKVGRTHLQDAVPIRMGQEFAAYRDTIVALEAELAHAQQQLFVLGIGGSAAGTGINVPRGFRTRILSELRRLFSEPRLKGAQNLGTAMQSQLPVMIFSNTLRAAALDLTRIVNDLRLLASGPMAGLGEITLPAVQPGSSIMPGKVNPSVLEMTNQVLFKVLGNDLSVAFAMQAGQLELNVMMPLMAHLTLESTHLMTNTLSILRTKCIEGIRANPKVCQKHLESSTAVVTALNPIIGYAKAAEVTKEALSTGKTIIEIVRARQILDEKQISDILSPERLTRAR